MRRKVIGTDQRPRLSVFRSNRHLYVQVISDESGRTLASASTVKVSDVRLTRETAAQLGKEIAEKCGKAGVERVVFDRSGYLYHGRLKALADAASEAGLRL